jgi:photosystem II stability/assembly factor-like uncharacterized protein
VPGEPNTFYFGGVAGGIWKTTDAGAIWRPLTDKQPFSSIGALAVADSDHNLLYAGTGEACIRGNITYGDGVYKSVDAGKTWKNIGLKDTLHIAKVLVDPRNPDVVFVAALGHAYGPNTERGVFRTADGGKIWEKVLYKDDKTGAIDLVFDPNNAHILFAALWEARRTPYSMTSGGPGSGLYKSIDGGTTWKRLEGHGLPAGVLGRIGVTVSGGDSNRVYALIEAAEGGLYRSDDAGETWQKVNDDHRFTQRAWYFTHIFADPKSAETVYILNTGLYRSNDGGKGFAILRAPHGDHHGLWIDRTNPARMIDGNDGGATITADGGKTWTRQDNQPTAQFYHVATDSRFLYYVYGAQQDNTTVAIASRTTHAFIGREDWYPAGGGESGFVVPSPADPEIVYAGSYDGLITRYDHRTGQEQNISAWPDNPMGAGAAELKHRFQWTMPIYISPSEPGAIYIGGEVLFKSTDGGMSWAVLSPDLSRNDKGKQQSSGGPITQDNTSVEYYDTIFAIAESPLAKGELWVGSDDGLVHLSRDGGAHWADVTPKEMPEWSMVSLIEPSPHDAAAAYLAIDRHKLDDRQPYIYKTGDFGKSWTKITSGLPEGSYVHAVREDPKHKGLLYAGTETGIWVSFDDGAHWQSLQLDLPTAPVHDLAIKDDDLVVATHGRSFWILDDLSPLRQMDPKTLQEGAHLFAPRAAYRVQGGGFVIPGGTGGQNPPPGAILYYSLKAAPKEKEEITLEILDGKGGVIRKFSNREKKPGEEANEFSFGGRSEKLPGEAGLNRFAWDLQYENPTRVPGSGHWGGQGEGPAAVPGEYQVKLTAAGKSDIAPLEVRGDPRLQVSQADLEKQFELARQIARAISEDHDAVNQIRDLRTQLNALRKRAGQDEQAKEILGAAAELDKKMTAVEEALIQTKSKSGEDPLNFPIKLDDKLSILEGAVESADTAPTKQEFEVFEELKAQLEPQLAAWGEIQKKDVPAFNEQVRKGNIPAIMIAPTGGEKHDSSVR